jgi:adenylyltransferase/sulfurtransferase
MFPFLEAGAASHATTLCGRDAVQITARTGTQLSLPSLAGRLRPLGVVTLNPFLLRFQADGCELTIFPDARAIIKGTTDPSVARALYARYVGN